MATTYDQDTAPGVRELVARALVNKALEVGKQDDPEAAITLYDQMVDTYGPDPAPGVREQVARALVGKALEVGKQDDPKAAITLYDQMVDTYGPDPAPGVRELVVSALAVKGAAAAALGDEKVARELWNRVLERETPDWAVGLAAFSLAALPAVNDEAGHAVNLLLTAAGVGTETASVCIQTLTGDPHTRKQALTDLRNMAAEDTDALNFLGIAVRAEGDTTLATKLWKQSEASGDSVAPLLLQRVPPNPPNA